MANRETAFQFEDRFPPYKWLSEQFQDKEKLVNIAGYIFEGFADMAVADYHLPEPNGWHENPRLRNREQLRSRLNYLAHGRKIGDRVIPAVTLANYKQCDVNGGYGQKDKLTFNCACRQLNAKCVHYLFYMFDLLRRGLDRLAAHKQLIETLDSFSAQLKQYLQSEPAGDGPAIEEGEDSGMRIDKLSDLIMKFVDDIAYIQMYERMAEPGGNPEANPAYNRYLLIGKREQFLLYAPDGRIGGILVLESILEQKVYVLRSYTNERDRLDYECCLHPGMQEALSAVIAHLDRADYMPGVIGNEYTAVSEDGIFHYSIDTKDSMSLKFAGLLAAAPLPL